MENLVANASTKSEVSIVKCLINIIDYFKIKHDYDITVDQFTKHIGKISVYEEIQKTLEALSITSVICENIDIIEAILYKQPILIDISNESSKNHFVICDYSVEAMVFIINDPINGKYYANLNGLESMWVNKKCIVFIA